MAKTLKPVNVWFRPVERGGRKSCPHCKRKLGNTGCWSWGEYVNAKWRNVHDVCRYCWSEVRERIADLCYKWWREPSIQCRHSHQPWWMTLEKIDFPDVPELNIMLDKADLSTLPICADWLEERGYHEQASYLRGYCKDHQPMEVVQ